MPHGSRLLGTCVIGLRTFRKKGLTARIPEPGYRYQHRHLLFGAYQLYRRHGEACALLLLTPAHAERALYHEIGSRSDSIANRGVLEAVDALYFDVAKGAPKRARRTAR